MVLILIGMEVVAAVEMIVKLWFILWADFVDETMVNAEVEMMVDGVVLMIVNPWG
jgi:hypothetical protein